MGWAERWVRRLFVLALVLMMATSLSWIAAPMAGELVHADRAAGEQALASPPGSRSSTDGLPIAQAPTPIPDSAAAPGPAAAPDQALVLPAPVGYVWPIKGAKLTTYFVATASGTMVLDGNPVHDGIDIARPCGWPIGAAHAGIVIYAGRRADPYLGFSGSMQPYYDELARRKLGDNVLAIMVVIDDGNGLVGVYAHLGKAIVQAGQAVAAGQTIGYEGATGNATGCHLHYELMVADGPWVRVAWNLVSKWHYPLWMRLRVDPLLYLPADSPDAATPRPGIARPADPPHYVAPPADVPVMTAT